jgi:MFS transporter, ACS family, hexuronate transporter
LPTRPIPSPSAEKSPFSASRAGNRRWLICGLLFFAATVNYMDRQVIGLLKPMLQVQLGWTEIDYSNIVF